MGDAVELMNNTAAFQTLNRTILCYSRTIYRSNGVWEGANPLTPILPMFLFQLTVCITATRLLLFIAKKCNQPPIIGEILSGVLLGPSVLGRFESLRVGVFPTYSFLVAEPMAHLALVYYAFLMGLEMDVRALPRSGSKAIRLAISGTVIPLIIAFCICSYFQYGPPHTESETLYGWLYGGLALTVTGFSALSKLLDRHSLANTEVGKVAMAAALLHEFSSWVLLAFVLAICKRSALGAFISLLSTTVAILGCVFGLRKGLGWVIRKTPEGQGYSEYYLCSILAGMGLVGVLMDVGGTHPMIGAFVFGLIIPNTVLEATLLDRLEDFVHGIFMPIFFIICGLRTNIDTITANDKSYILAFILLVAACSAKVVAAVSVSGLNNMKFQETLTLGILTSTKSTMALIILEIGQEQRALSTQTYSLLMVAVLIMTMVVTPITAFQNPNTDDMEPYKRKTIQKSRADEELRVLACVHGMQNVPAILTILDASYATRFSPMSVFVVHLVELVGRAAAPLIIHNARKAGPRNPTHTEAITEQIVMALDNFELKHDFLTVQAMTSKSAYATMDEDICSIATKNRAAIIILPFHKVQLLDGEMEDINPAIRSVNENVLANAPCSVAILIDRGLAESGQPARRICMLYFGGPDDREAISYCWRMCEQEETVLTVTRFVPSPNAMTMETTTGFDDNAEDVTLDIDAEREERLDNDFLEKFKAATVNSEAISYSEMMVNDEEEMIRAIKAMDGQHDLYVVGKGRGVVSPLTAELTDWCDCPELGAIGDLLVTSEFESGFAVLVVQQYVKIKEIKEGSVRSAGSLEEVRSLDWRLSQRD